MSSLENIPPQGLEDGSVGKSAGCSCKGPEFSFQLLMFDDSQLLVTPAAREPVPSMGTHSHAYIDPERHMYAHT